MEKDRVVAALAALAQESRLDTYRLLVQTGPEGMPAGEIAAELGIAPNTLSFHFDRLRHAGLVSVIRGGTSCCGPSSVAACCDPITSNLYDVAQKHAVPDSAVLASLGCGNPTALAQLAEGETVLDLGSGGGIDVLLSAGRVGPTGKAYGLDMTDEMLALARENQQKAGVQNVK